MKRTLSAILCLAACAAAFTGCGDKGNTAITVISREEGSGTRGAFVELMGILEKDADGNEKDLTTTSAETSQSTSVVISTVQGNKNAIGYISLGSLSSDVKAVKVDGVEASVDTVKDGSYKVARPFVICTKDEISDAANDFMNFILSSEGQSIIENDGYISVAGDNAYTSSEPSGKITVAGSTSVGPVMEKLADAYMELNSGVTVEIQQTGSGAGITSTIEGACDIGMSSRELKQEELDKGLTPTQIAMDGIAVIVNKDNEVSELTSEQIKSIYVGETTDWNDINGK